MMYTNATDVYYFYIIGTIVWSGPCMADDTRFYFGITDDLWAIRRWFTSWNAPARLEYASWATSLAEAEGQMDRLWETYPNDMNIWRKPGNPYTGVFMTSDVHWVIDMMTCPCWSRHTMYCSCSATASV